MALTQQDQAGGWSSATQRIHSYNLARSWDSSSSSAGSKTSDKPAALGRAGSQQEFSHVSMVRLSLFLNLVVHVVFFLPACINLISVFSFYCQGTLLADL
jgi:hypothetical protein